MSIFKQTFKPFLCRQINARQDLVSIAGTRPSEFHQYTTAKSPWVRMQSFVNYNGSDALARKYVLEAGTLIPSPDSNNTTDYAMRYGIGAANAAYGSNLGNRDYGLMPMPGITSVNIRSKSAYGSLREATIKFMCWDKKQLEELEILFMRPGYEVLLEWGWSMYIDSSVSGEQYDARPDQGSVIQKVNINDRFGLGLIKSFDSPTINTFQSGITQDDIYDRIKRYQHKFSGNYDATLGKIVNFSWNLLPNGGYECTTILISIGDILDSLKINSSTGNRISDQDKKDYRSEFELLLEKIKIPVTDDSGITELIEGAKKIPGVDTSCKFISYTKKSTGKSSDGPVYYMQFAFLIYILNERFNLFNGDQKYIDIEIPVYSKTNLGNGLCLASQHSISIDPQTCLIKNPKATFFSQNTDQKGFDLWKIFADKGDPFGINQDGTLGNIYKELEKKNFYSTPPMNDYLYDTTNLGVIGNIYVSLNHIESVYKSLSEGNNGSVGLGMFITEILKAVSFSLGSINDFDIYVQDNKAVIIDKHYTETGQDSAYSNKFMLNLTGNNSVVRNVSAVSKIFQNQTTMIAIAAQNRDNVAGIQSSTNVYLNNNISNRLTDQLVEYTNKNSTNAEQDKQQLLINDMISLVDYVQKYLMQLSLPDEPSPTTSINSKLNSLILKVSTDANHRAIIPISLDVTLDGIGGITIGEIFTVNPDVLPKEYANKNIGFIVTGISSDIVRAEWKTTLTTQICLLDQEVLSKNAYKIPDTLSLQEQVTGAIANNYNNIHQSIFYYNLLAAFIKDYSGRKIVYSNEKGLYLDLIGPGPLVTNTEAVLNEYNAASFGLYFSDVMNEMTSAFKTTSVSVSGVTNLYLKRAIEISKYYSRLIGDIKTKFDEQSKAFYQAAGALNQSYPFVCYLPNAVSTSGILDQTKVFNRIIIIDKRVF